MHGAVSHTSQCLPDVILRRSFTRPSTALAVIEGLGTRLATTVLNNNGLISRLLWNANMSCGESLVSFLMWHCNQNRTRVFRTERRQFACCSPDYASSKLPTTFAPFHVLSLWVCPDSIKVFAPPFYLWRCSREKKNTRLSMPAQLQCSRSGVWEPGPGNEATLTKQRVGFDFIPKHWVVVWEWD